jgi:hypothetical protein
MSTRIGNRRSPEGRRYIYTKEALINSSFRTNPGLDPGGDPESVCYESMSYWIIRFAHPAGRPLGVQQRATRFCPALPE